MLLWLWRRLVATVPITPLAWELPYAVGAALKRQKRQKNKKGVPVIAQWLMNPTGNHEVASSIPGLTQQIKDLVFLQGAA